MTYITFSFFCYFQTCSWFVAFFMWSQISKTFPNIFTEKKNLCISGPAQLKPVWFKGKLYFSFFLQFH